ncbi:MAG: hypothetical protein LC798_21210 [Chloroflexi bacterium]|nr:hypothetical protein [Chloroflexota bacterium]
MIPADKILSFLAILEASEHLGGKSDWAEGYNIGRRESLTQVRAYVEAVLAPEPAATLAEIERGRVA